MSLTAYHKFANNDVFEVANFKHNGWCAPIAMARALASDPQDAMEVARLARKVANDIRSGGAPGEFERGAYYGDMGRLAAWYGFRKVRKAKRRKARVRFRRRANRNQIYPTVAQFFRANPDVTEAIVQTTGHAAYVNRREGYALSARMRVDTVVVLDPSRRQETAHASAETVSRPPAPPPICGVDGQLPLKIEAMEGQLSLF